MYFAWNNSTVSPVLENGDIRYLSISRQLLDSLLIAFPSPLTAHRFGLTRKLLADCRNCLSSSILPDIKHCPDIKGDVDGLYVSGKRRVKIGGQLFQVSFSRKDIYSALNNCKAILSAIGDNKGASLFSRLISVLRGGKAKPTSPCHFPKQPAPPLPEHNQPSPLYNWSPRLPVIQQPRASYSDYHTVNSVSAFYTGNGRLTGFRIDRF